VSLAQNLSSVILSLTGNAETFQCTCWRRKWQSIQISSGWGRSCRIHTAAVYRRFTRKPSWRKAKRATAMRVWRPL